MPAPLSANQVRAVRFSKSRSGYSPVAVNRFLDEVAARLEGRATLSAAQVAATVFRTPALSGWGYDRDEVDALQQRIIATLAASEPPTSDPAEEQ